MSSEVKNLFEQSGLEKEEDMDPHQGVDVCTSIAL